MDISLNKNFDSSEWQKQKALKKIRPQVILQPFSADKRGLTYDKAV